MHTRTTLTGLLLVATLCFALPARATLYDRGGGFLYDDVLNVTWLQDANYAKTSGYDADGLMTWSQASTWAADLVYGGYDDWRLAGNSPVNGSTWNYSYAPNGTTDVGYNITSPNSELAYMYYVNLGLKGNLSPSGAVQPDYGIFGNGTYGGQANVGPVQNLQSFMYWSGTTYAFNPTSYAWSFTTQYGDQRLSQYTALPNGTSWVSFAWAVRPGDVAAPIPEPETYAMLLVGLGLVGTMVRRRKQVAA